MPLRLKPRYTASVTLLGAGEARLRLREPTTELRLDLTPILQGPAGPAGPPGDASKTFIFNTPDIHWVVNHDLGYRPGIGVFTLGGKAMDAEEVHMSLNQVVVSFNQPTTGYVICT